MAPAAQGVDPGPVRTLVAIRGVAHGPRPSPIVPAPCQVDDAAVRGVGARSHREVDASSFIDILRSMATTTLPATRHAVHWFHALSDETRLEIVALLSHGERCVCELQDALAAAQSRLSFHLKVLKDAGLIGDRREGRWMFYGLERETLDQIAAYTKSVKPGKHAGSCAVACCD